MKRSAAFAVVLVTVPDRKTARRLARLILDEHLAACVNLVPRLESHYWWQGKIERSGEIQLVIKTTRRNLVRLETTVLAAHPYETPEFLVLPVQAGSSGYLKWLAANCH
jgi:periplasmic divalent cation tolerance protein